MIKKLSYRLTDLATNNARLISTLLIYIIVLSVTIGIKPLTPSTVTAALTVQGSLYIDVSEVEGNDLIEIHNPTDKVISTKGLYLSDNNDDLSKTGLFKWQMPSFIIQPGKSILIRESENEATEVLKRAMTNFDIASAEKVLLSNADGEIISMWEPTVCNDCGKCVEYTIEDIMEMNEGNANFLIEYNSSGNVRSITGRFDDVTVTDYDSAFTFVCSLKKILGIENPSAILRGLMNTDGYTQTIRDYISYVRRIDGGDFYWFNQIEKGVRVFTLDHGETPRGLGFTTTQEGKVTHIAVHFYAPILDFTNIDIDVDPILTVLI